MSVSEIINYLTCYYGALEDASSTKIDVSF